MKGFDSLSQSKKIHTKLQSEEDVSRNRSETSHRDIAKRAQTLTLPKGESREKKKERFSLRKPTELFVQKSGKLFSSMTRRHWCMIVLVLALSYIVYGLGFFLRTERNIQTIIASPGILVTDQGQQIMRDLFGDYQVIGVVVGNPLLPIEPLTSYGHILHHARALSLALRDVVDLRDDVLAWGQSSHDQSIFPIFDTVFDILGPRADDIGGVRMKIEDLLHHPSQTLRNIEKGFSAFLEHKQTWYALAGRGKPTRILLLNQNSDELRAGGGFPGTAFLLEMNEGKVTQLSFQDIYALDWKLTGYRPSPEGINQFKSINYPGKPVEFEIRDANYYPLFHDSAVKLSSLMQEAGYGSVDLVVGVNQKFLEDIMRLVEPIELPGVSVKIDHYNAFLILSMLVEGKKTLETETETENRNTQGLLAQSTPKSTVKTLGKSIFEKLQSEGKLDQAVAILVGHILRGEVVAGSARPDVQGALDDLGLFDRWRTATDDWIYPLFTSISRNKSDRLMERTFMINHISSCERTLTLTQKHWFDATERSRVIHLAHELGLSEKVSTLIPIQGGGDNVQYLRFILPSGTQMLSDSSPNFRLLETTPLYTTIDGYETTKPNTTSTTSIHYKLPEKYCTESTEFFKQPGLRNTRVLVQKNGKTEYQKFYE